MERRKFLRSGCTLCLLTAAGLAVTDLTSCSPASYPIYRTEVSNKKVSIPLSLFEQASLQIVRPKDMYFDIAVQKKEDNTYQALLLLCTHQDTQLDVTPKGYSCSLHGSRFDKNGNVIKGPAEKPLEHFKTFVENNNLIISI